MGTYTHRVAISNHRLVSLEDDEVRFRYKDYAYGNRRKVLSLKPAEFIRRFLLHVLPSGFMRIRHYGILANRTKREKLAQARTALDSAPAPQPPEPESVATFWLRVASLDIHQCPHCKAGRMIVIGSISAWRARAPPPPPS
jgi:Putative transposase